MTKRILIVDDHQENHYLLQTLLQSSGYAVESAMQGAEALTIARQRPPDLLISDILMPVMDGFSLCREWKQDDRLQHIPFIFYSATYTDKRDQEFALHLGADRFIVKPEEPEVFVSIIQDTLQAYDASVPQEPAAPSPGPDESVYLKQYNEVLIRKLESKMEQLEQVNRDLRDELAASKNMEAALLDSEAQFKSLIEVAPEGIFVQQSGKIVFLNSAMLRILGASKPEDLLEADFLAYIAPEFHDSIRKRIQLQSSTGLPVPPEEQEYLRLDGSRIPVETTAVRVRFQGSDAHLVFVRDITKRKQIEEENDRLEQQLRQSQKLEAIGKLAGGVAHDFNNILFAIIGYSDLVRPCVAEDASLAGKIDNINKCAWRGAELTRQLLAFSRKQVLDPKVVSLNTIVSGMEDMLCRLIGEHIDLKTSLAPDLGAIKADPGQLEQVLMNLVVNSRDAMPTGGTITIMTENVHIDEAIAARHMAMSPGSFAMLTVTDTGFGMDEETRARIFEPFFTTKGPGGGTGLGLATVYGIVKQSGGDVLCTSHLGRGTTFTIFLPIVPDDSTVVPEAASHHATAGCETILVTEDDGAVREIATAVLKNAGYRVLSAENAQEALQLCENHKGAIHMLITDVVMPGMSGKQLSEKLLERYPGLKILFSSGYTNGEIVDHGILNEGTSFLQKPYNAETLKQKVRKVLDTPQTRPNR